MIKVLFYFYNFAFCTINQLRSWIVCWYSVDSSICLGWVSAGLPCSTAYMRTGLSRGRGSWCWGAGTLHMEGFVWTQNQTISEHSANKKHIFLTDCYIIWFMLTIYYMNQRECKLLCWFWVILSLSWFVNFENQDKLLRILSDRLFQNQTSNFGLIQNDWE